VNPAWAVFFVWAGCAVGMVLLYAIARQIGNMGLVDLGWTVGIGAGAIFLASVAGGAPDRRWLTALLAAVWSLRLGSYVAKDRVLGAEEDARYAMLREKFGDRQNAWFFVFFQIQAVWVAMFAAAMLPAMYLDVPLWQWYDLAAVGVWAVAVGGESLADRQLSRWKRDPAHQGRTCRAGLWHYSRHPNYFFEWVHWFNYALLAAGWIWALAALAGPAVMLVLLFKVTGIPYTEKRAVAHRGDDYRQYQRTTSVFVPWPPKSDPEAA
jgi:steroid 5-alpha reductase family enzyme